MLILLFSWLHFSCGRHCLVTACISTIKICSIVLYQMAPSPWKVQPRKRPNEHFVVVKAPQNSRQQNVDFVVFVAALFLWSSFPWSMHASPCIHASMHPCIHASIHPSIHACMHQNLFHCPLPNGSLNMESAATKTRKPLFCPCSPPEFTTTKC